MKQCTHKTRQSTSPRAPFPATAAHNTAASSRPQARGKRDSQDLAGALDARHSRQHHHQAAHQDGQADAAEDEC